MWIVLPSLSLAAVIVGIVVGALTMALSWVSLIFLPLLLIVGVIYCIPTIIASSRKTKHRLPLILVNVVLGFLPMVWFGCLIWALVDPTETPQAIA